MLQISLLLIRVSIKPRLPFSTCNVFFVSKGNLLDFYFRVSIKNSADPNLTTQRCKVTWPRGYKTFFMLNSTEHEIFHTNKSQITNNAKVFLAKHS